MTTPVTASSLAQALTAEALTRARRRLLTGHPDPTRANAPTSASLTVDQLRVLRCERLGADGKKILVDAYEAACQRSVTGALPGYSGSWRRHITHSAQMLARVRSSLAALISEGDEPSTSTPSAHPTPTTPTYSAQP